MAKSRSKVGGRRKRSSAEKPKSPPPSGAKSSPRTGEKSGAKTVVASKPRPPRGDGRIQKRGGDPMPKKRKIRREESEEQIRPPE